MTFIFCAQTPPKINNTNILKPQAINPQVSCRLRLCFSEMLKQYYPIATNLEKLRSLSKFIVTDCLKINIELEI
jgi:hypothetical protein